jgi:16S rRNA (cytidine1402-2'-O)-methyltransferase
MSAENPPVASTDRGSQRSATGQDGRLLLCATPIGNLKDVTLRVLAALAEADVVACEDTRHTKLLLDRHRIVAASLVSFHEHNERARAQELVARIAAGAVVALVSDAGTPLVSDPGFALVRACVMAGLVVEALPGPSAVVAALAVSGLPGERWRFVGFLPRARAELDRLLVDVPETLVAFESPRRLVTTLRVLAARDPRRPVAVCRELTKLHEEISRGSASELADRYEAHPPRGEIVLVVGAAAPGAPAREQALGALRELIDAGAKPRPAAAAVAKLTGVGANELYRALTSEA